MVQMPCPRKRISNTRPTAFSETYQVRVMACLRRDSCKPQHVLIGHTCAQRRLALMFLTGSLHLKLDYATGLKCCLSALRT